MISRAKKKGTATERRARAERIADALTPAERRVLDRLLLGESAKSIGMKLDLSTFTVSNHTRAIFSAFGAHSRAAVLALFVVPPPPQS
jgi:DNA-binding NarL/FixJ family response regulator